MKTVLQIETNSRGTESELKMKILKTSEFYHPNKTSPPLNNFDTLLDISRATTFEWPPMTYSLGNTKRGGWETKVCGNNKFLENLGALAQPARKKELG